MICPPCAEAADQTARIIADHPDFGPNAHLAGICRDAAIQPHGCCCQHGQRNVTDGKEAGR